MRYAKDNYYLYAVPPEVILLLKGCSHTTSTAS